MHRLPQCHLGNPRVECQNTHKVNQYGTPLSPRVFIARHTSSVLKSIKVFNPINEISKGKLNSSQQDIEGKTPYDLTILTKPVIQQDRPKSRSREREIEKEIKHIATGTNPHPRGWTTPSSSRKKKDYSLLIVVASGMMKMATGHDLPSGGVPERVLD